MFHGTIDVSTAKALRELQARIKGKKLPSSKLDESLLVASWNIREFGKSKRSPLALHLIAEIMGQFDLVTVIELREDLSQLATVLSFLGPYWKVVYSDTTEDPGANYERLAFIYDERAVQFKGFASSAIPPRKKVKQEYLSEESFWRAPYCAGFQSGNFDFVAISAHIRWGDKASRVDELRRFAKWVGDKSKREYYVDTDILVFGDFNTESPEMFQALTETGLKLPDPLRDIKTSLKGEHYDHILHFPRFTKTFTNKGGVLDVFTENDADWFDGMEPSRFTYELSDHYPVWACLDTDTDAEKLDQLIKLSKRPKSSG